MSTYGSNVTQKIIPVFVAGTNGTSGVFTYTVPANSILELVNMSHGFGDGSFGGGWQLRNPSGEVIQNFASGAYVYTNGSMYRLPAGYSIVMTANAIAGGPYRLGGNLLQNTP